MTNLIPWKLGRLAPTLRGARSLSWDLQDFDRLFDEIWSGSGAGLAPGAGFSPRVDVCEDEAGYRITAELPGLEEKDLEVSLDGDVLTLSGEKRDTREREHEGYRHLETTSGRFERRFRLPAEVDPDKVSAKLEHGVLTVTVPKSEAARPRTIRVTAS